MNVKTLLLLAACALPSAHSYRLSSFHRPGADALIARQIDSLMAEHVQKEQFSGVIRVSRWEHVLYSRAFGFADREKKIHNEVNTHFNICSTGKLFTAVLIMQLYERGLLDLSAPLRRYLPEYRIKNDSVITIHHLLTHTSGLGDYLFADDAAIPPNWTLETVTRVIAGLPLALPRPGLQFQYANSNYILLGRIIEKLTGRPYLENVRLHILLPLHLSNTLLTGQHELMPPKKARPYYIFSETAYIAAPPDDRGPLFSDGGEFTTAEDLGKFSMGIMRNVLVSEKTKQLMFHNYVSTNWGRDYGYGCELSEVAGRKLAGHTGGGHGYSTSLKMSLADGYSVVVLINNRQFPDEVADRIFSILYRGRYDPVLADDQNILFSAYERSGLDFVLKNYNDILIRNGKGRLTSFWPLTGLGDIFVELKKYSEAVSVYKATIEAFPAESGPIDGLGIVYLKTGHKQEAEKAFRRSLSLNPGDYFAQKYLKELRGE